MSKQTASVPPHLGKGAQTRERILDAALEAFAEQGFNNVSLREIAARADLTHVGLLHHFPTKEDLLIRVLERRDERDLLTFKEAEAPLGRALLVWAMRIVYRNTSTPGAASLYARLSSEAADPGHPAHHHFVDRYARLARALTESLRSEFAGAPPPNGASAETAARTFLALMDGLQLQWLLDSSVDMVGILLMYLEQTGITITHDELATEGHQ